MMVTSSQRFTRDQVCPVCGGHSGLPQGRGIRCYGFNSRDGQWAHCTRSEKAGVLRETRAGTYAHRLDGYCLCGHQHGTMPISPPRGELINDVERMEAARRIWSRTWPASGTTVETYLRSRGLTLSIPSSLRYAVLKHGPTECEMPAMVASIQVWPSLDPVAVHRTFLKSDGSGKADIAKSKMVLGPMRGGSVQLGKPAEILLISEGIETALSGQQETGIPAWAAICTTNMHNLVLPKLPAAKQIVIAADNDEAGVKAARQAALKWMWQGRQVRIALPPKGKDLNDLLRGCL